MQKWAVRDSHQNVSPKSLTDSHQNVAGADIVLAAHSGLMSGLHLQLSAICAGGKVEAMLFNAGDLTVDVPAGQLRVMVTKVLWPQLKSDDAWSMPSASDAPPGSGWRAQLAKTHPGHHLSLPTSQQRHNSVHKHAGPRPLCPDPAWADAVEMAGLLSVKMFGATGNSTHDDAPAVRRAINASLHCGGCVFFPAGHYQFATTVVIHGVSADTVSNYVC